ncbi:MAG: protein translocase subunit SecD [Holophagales bacterium]|nr:protein translocase subunit SecD [Holophagales bacterium]
MDTNLTYRGLLIFAVVASASFSAYPADEKINLGLDLQGGMHLVVQVNTDDAIGAETENTMDALQRELEELDITGTQMEQLGTRSFQVSGVPADKVSEIRDDVLDVYLPGWEMTTEGGGRLRFELTAQEAGSIRQLSVNQARETIRNRVDAFGVAEPIIHDEGIGSDRIVVQLPGVDDPQRVKDLIGQTAFLELRLVAEGTGPAGTRQGAVDQLPAGLTDEFEIFEETLRDENKRSIGEQFWVLEKRRVITGRDLKTAHTSTGEFGEPTVSFVLTRDGGDKFAEVTAANIGRGLAVVLDEKVESVATIRDRIRDQGVIHGSFTLQEVQDLVTVLRSGALPASLEFLEERTVGPTLGRDSIEKGSRAGMIGGGLVVITMLLVYKLTGINAVVALLLNVVLVFGALAAFDATLTLPGIAGIVLTIGMAVDANVLIFERIREELRSGRTVKSAIGAGFSKALSSILDANITTLIAAIFLFTFGTGPIRGFAVTLSVGIVASVFTAVFISRFIFDLLYARKSRVDRLSI